MAGWEVLNREKAIALQEALGTIKQLSDGEESERLHRAQHDMACRSDDSFVQTVLIVELTQVVGDVVASNRDLAAKVERQEKRIRELEAQLAEGVVG